MKNILIFCLKIFNFSVINFSVYLNRRVFVMGACVNNTDGAKLAFIRFMRYLCIYSVLVL